jgi:hypothetical protein
MEKMAFRPILQFHAEIIERIVKSMSGAFQKVYWVSKTLKNSQKTYNEQTHVIFAVYRRTGTYSLQST